MKRVEILVLAVILALVVPMLAQAAIPASERAALIAFYNSTGGNSWDTNTGWKGNNNEADGFSAVGTEGNWYGVTVANGRVTELELSDNFLLGTLPPELGDLPMLVTLDLSYNSIEGQLPTQMQSLTRLKHLYLDGNLLSGSIPSFITTLSNLETLWMGWNEFDGAIPASLSNLTKLTDLDLGCNYHTGTIPASLGSMINLQSLSLVCNNLTGSIPKELGNLSNLTFLWLEGNALSGTLPPELGKLKKLNYLWLQYNNITGSIPTQYGGLSSVYYICLSANKLTGSIPKELGNLDNLGVLALYSNNLSGAIPPEMGKLSNLAALYIDDNKLSGPIPKELGNLRNLFDLYMNGNQLVGDVPSSFKNLTNLDAQYTHIGYNGLYANDSTVKTFLDGKDKDWAGTQTVPPADLTVAGTSASTVSLSWTPIDFTNYAGGYRVYYSTTSGGPWTEAGMTASKSASSYEVTGLTGSTTYYFVVASETDPNAWNKNTVTSDNSQEVSATTDLMAGQFLLSIKSSPAAGVGITVSLSDVNGSRNGSTEFTRVYNTGAAVTLTAPATYQGGNFLRWEVDGTHTQATSVQVTMDANHTATAFYEEVTPVHTLLVRSNPDEGIPVEVSPADNNGATTGSTRFSRKYDEGTEVTLTAPEAFNGKVFSKWVVNGSELGTSTVLVKMDGPRSAEVYYEEAPAADQYTLTVESTHGHGAVITVSPTDNEGNGDGVTKFTRVYDTGTVVTLVAPEDHNDKKFANWKLDGVIRTNSRTLQVTMDSDHKAKAFYTTASRPGLVLSRGKVNFGYIAGGMLPPAQAIRVTINGDPVSWTASADVPWLTLTPASGHGTTEVAVALNDTVTALAEGSYTANITVEAPDADNSPQYVQVKLNVLSPNDSSAPVGEFSTPQDGTVVYSSVPVTGWVVDDVGVDSVKLYREEGSRLVYIGDAVFVEGARPDVEELFPDYPGNYAAGWGYMLLTNFFPNEGNGTFVIHAVATDVEGNSITLGTKTLVCDNANSIKPFGALDSPGQGSTVSGSGFINWGWVLTPQPNFIPTDGSTIKVIVDGVEIGNPEYNIYREDIATFFPGYANSDGAVGYFILDTTVYEDGLHSIQWLATDNAGNRDGIGSRYFSIQNSGENRTQSMERAVFRGTPRFISPDIIPTLPIDHTTPVNVRRGCRVGDTGQRVYPGPNGDIVIDSSELEPIEIRFPEDSEAQGYLQVGGHLHNLPVGTTMDSLESVFSWSPGAGFVGQYRLVFVLTGPGGELTRRDITMRIAAKH